MYESDAWTLNDGKKDITTKFSDFKDKKNKDFDSKKEYNKLSDDITVLAKMDTGEYEPVEGDVEIVQVLDIVKNPEEIKKITANYDLVKLKEKEEYYRKKSQTEKRKAIAKALEKNWPLFIEKPDGTISELIRLSPEGLPIYYRTDNVNAAKSTRTNHINTGGSLGLNLNGQGMTVRVWDGGNDNVAPNKELAAINDKYNKLIFQFLFVIYSIKKLRFLIY